MSERRFAIFETKDSSYAPVWVIESELKRRLDKILQYALVPNPYDELIDILLHGEGKEEPDDQPSPTATSENWRQVFWLGHGCPVGVLYGDDGEMQCNNINVHKPIDFKRDSLINILETLPKPSPTPTRAEWEAWVKKMPNLHMRTITDWQEDMAQWFLTMPIVPKE